MFVQDREGKQALNPTRSLKYHVREDFKSMRLNKYMRRENNETIPY